MRRRGARRNARLTTEKKPHQVAQLFGSFKDDTLSDAHDDSDELKSEGRWVTGFCDLGDLTL